jgi:hypothetical protein
LAKIGSSRRVERSIQFLGAASGEVAKAWRDFFFLVFGFSRSASTCFQNSSLGIPQPADFLAPFFEDLVEAVGGRKNQTIQFVLIVHLSMAIGLPLRMTTTDPSGFPSRMS